MSMHRVIRSLLLSFSLLWAAEANAQQPDLVVFIAVDQLRGDYLERFGSQLSGGLARLKNQGAYFVNGYHDHAVTVTAVGHASMLSGRFPRSTGIIAKVG